MMPDTHRDFHNLKVGPSVWQPSTEAYPNPCY